MVNQIHKSKADFFIKMIDEANGNGKLIWENMNKLLGPNKNTKTSDMQLLVSGALCGQMDVIVSTCNHFFIHWIEELTKTLKCPDIPIKPPDPDKPVFTIRDITIPDVLKIISSYVS